MHRLRFTNDLRRAVANADLVQESGPKSLELKQALFSQFDKFTRAGVPVVSSPPGITPTDFQTESPRVC
ncbi:3-hydroxyacyl-CoA dehydrogenase NAD-binding domain-containing protein [Caballeronia novacaledonica]|uniref:3-hydroxyacyl-CoA dehydrogenase NAD-binding domain-containing protein n=1 Tax=Caballeronia novacaledonica TaxID=1544861 RepID=UPI003857AB2E